jgi:hypothetical protein
MLECLRLGVILDHAVMQFHATEWLPERWGKNDIFPQVARHAQLATWGIHMVLVPVVKNPLLLGQFGDVAYHPTKT